MRTQEFNSKLISLLPLDEVPVHVHPFAARAPCDSKGSECQCGIHTAEAASAQRSRKTERAAKEKPTPISQFFFSTCCALRRPPREGGHPASPLPPPIGAISKHAFLEATTYWRQRVEKPRQPCGLGDLGRKPRQACCRFACLGLIVRKISFDSKLISLLPLDDAPVHVPLRRPR